MRRTLAFAAVLAVVAGAVVASVATAAPPDRPSTLRPWGRGPAAHATAETATPKGATRLVVIGQEADFTIIDTAPRATAPATRSCSPTTCSTRPAAASAATRPAAPSCSATTSSATPPSFSTAGAS